MYTTEGRVSLPVHGLTMICPFVARAFGQFRPFEEDILDFGFARSKFLADVGEFRSSRALANFLFSRSPWKSVGAEIASLIVFV